MVALTLCIRRSLGVTHMLLVVTVVVWKWEKDLPTMMTTNDAPSSLRLPNDYDSTKWNIQRMGPTKENVGIEFRSPPEASQNNEITFQTNQSNTFAARVNTMCLSLPEAWILYQSIYKPKVFYSCKISTYIPGNGVYVSNEAGNMLSLAKTGVKLQYQSSNGILCSTV